MCKELPGDYLVVIPIGVESSDEGGCLEEPEGAAAQEPLWREHIAAALSHYSTQHSLALIANTKHFVELFSDQNITQPGASVFSQDGK